MIQLKRLPEPTVLTSNAATWTADLVQKDIDWKNAQTRLSTLTTAEPNYSEAKKAENEAKKAREAAQKHYDQKEVRETLREMTTGSAVIGKCMYCETFITSKNWEDIEHFEPKDQYPSECFEWDNLLLSCGGCNRPPGKGTHDTRSLPIVNPILDNPAAYFIYKEQKIKVNPAAPDIETAERTINVCDLERLQFLRPRFKINEDFEKLKQDIKKVIGDYEKVKTVATKSKKAKVIYDVLLDLQQKAHYNQAYAGYLRYLLRSSTTLTQAVAIVNSHKSALRLSTDFEWAW